MKISFERLKKEQKIFLDKDVLKFSNLNLRDDLCGAIEYVLTIYLLKSNIPMIEIKGSLAGEVSLACDRCAETFVKYLKYDMDEVYELEKKEILDNEIDIISKVKDFILNNFPIKILCREDCKGFCIDCRTNLNKESCKCKI